MIGRSVRFGVGKESTRGTSVAPNYWVPTLEPASIKNKPTYIDDESGFGVGVDTDDSVIALESAEGEISGKIQDLSFGYFLLAALGQVSSAVKETTAYNHTFSYLNSNQHPALTLAVKDDAEQFRYALGMIESLKISGEVGKFVEYSASFKAKKGATASDTVTYVEQNEFFSKMITFKIATNLAGLDGASAVKIRSFELNIEKNLELINNLGSTQPDDIQNTVMTIDGNIEAYFTDTTLKAIHEGGTQKAIRIDIINSDVTIGTSSNPELKMDFAKVKFQEWELGGGQNEQVLQTLKFKAHYSLADSAILSAILTNTKTSY